MKSRAVSTMPSLERKFSSSGDLLHLGVALGEAQDVVDVAAAPLVDRLVVVADHADAGAEVVQRPDDASWTGLTSWYSSTITYFTRSARRARSASSFVRSSTASSRIDE